MTTTAIGGENSGGAEEIMLFGVRVVVDSMRKSVSLNDLSQYQHRTDCANVNLGRDKEDAGGGGYASADEAVHRSSSPIGANRVRKRGIPWTEEEHKLFLLGLQKVGKGDWRGISRNFVKTRTPTQVASHAQKYFLRRSNFNRRRRRSSLFDITTDSVAATTPTINHQINKENAVSQSPPLRGPTPANLEISSLRFPATIPVYPLTVSENNEGIESNNAQYPENKLMPTVPTMVDFNLNQKSMSTDPSPLSLKLSLSLSTDQSSSSRLSAFQVMPSFNNGDSIISSVA